MIGRLQIGTNREPDHTEQAHIELTMRALNRKTKSKHYPSPAASSLVRSMSCESCRSAIGSLQPPSDLLDLTGDMETGRTRLEAGVLGITGW